jgi:hypothetical protein
MGASYPLYYLEQCNCHLVAAGKNDAMNLPPDVSAIVEELVPLFRRWCGGRYAISLAGSYAKGTADSYSDIDFYMFAEEAVPTPQRIASAKQHDPPIARISGGGNADSSWGACTNLNYRGYRIETSIRTIGLIDRSISECIDGVVRQEMAEWTICGYYNHCCLADISISRALDDRFEILAGWKE